MIINGIYYVISSGAYASFNEMDHHLGRGAMVWLCSRGHWDQFACVQISAPFYIMCTTLSDLSVFPFSAW
jgi:hypothetical protein